MEYSTLKFLEAVDDSSMPVSTKLIRESLRRGSYPGKNIELNEATADIVSIELVDEPYGQGVSVKQADGHEYRYAADELSQKYNTPEKLCAAANKLLKFRSSGAVLGWLRNNAILYSGSKLAKKANEALSMEVRSELQSLILNLHPEWHMSKVNERIAAFLEKYNINDDWEYFGMPPREVRAFFDV